MGINSVDSIIAEGLNMGKETRERSGIMARIKIEDLPKDVKISKEEMRDVLGGSRAFNAPGLNAPGLNAPSLNAPYLNAPTLQGNAPTTVLATSILPSSPGDADD